MPRALDGEQVAALAGVTVRWLARMNAEGKGPERTPDGAYPCDAAGRWLDRRLAEKYGIANDGQAYDYEAERARLTKAQADKTELEVRELRGEIVRVETVVEHWGRAIGAARSRLLSLPAKIAARFADPAKRPAVEAGARELVYEVCNELGSDAIPERARSRLRGDDPDLAPAAGPVDQPVGGSVPEAQPRGKRRAGRLSDGAG